MLKTGPDYEASGSTTDIHELQAALQAAQLTATGTGSKYSGTQQDSQIEAYLTDWDRAYHLDYKLVLFLV